MAIKLEGPWDKGFALDLHTTESTFLGEDEYGNPRFDTKYTAIGKLLNHLKYKRDASTIPGIIDKICKSVSGIHKFDFIIAVPPSNIDRSFQPVFLVCEALSNKVKVPYLPNALSKKKLTKELKNIYEFDERVKLLTGNFRLKAGLDLSNKKVLLLDDLYRSGATLAAITNFLYNDCNTEKVSVLTLTKTRSNR